MSSTPSATYPSDIKIENYDPGTLQKELESYLGSIVDRSSILSVSVTALGRDVAQELADTLGSSPIPTIQTLHLDCMSEDPYESPDGSRDPSELLVKVVPLPIQAASLKDVSLHNITLPWNPPLFSQCARLRIDLDGNLDAYQRPSHSAMRDVLTGMHVLEHLFLGDMFPRYPRSVLQSSLARITVSDTCRSITLRADEHHADFLHFFPSLKTTSTFNQLNLIITCDADRSEFMRILTDSAPPRAARLYECNFEGDLGCGTISVSRDASAWLASPCSALSSAPALPIRVRFRAAPSGVAPWNDEPANYHEDIDRFSDSLRAFNLSQIRVLHLQECSFEGMMVTGYRSIRTYHPLLLSAPRVEVLIVSSESGERLSTFYDALAGHNTTNRMLLPRLHTLVVAMWRLDKCFDSFDEPSCQAIKRMLEARRAEDCPLRILQVPSLFEDRECWTDIKKLVQVQFIDITKTDYEGAMIYDWQKWPPVV